MTVASKQGSWTDRMYDRVVSRLPSRLAAAIDLIRPGYRRAWGGPFNGQHARVEMLKELLACFSPSAVIETGTHRGTTTGFLRELTRAPIFTVESYPRFHHYSRLRFLLDEAVHPLLGDSRKLLRELGARADVPKEQALFYLDAHWGSDLPLREELEIVRSHWNSAVLIIDDFRVPADPGYGYDDYGRDKTLSLEAFPLLREPPYFPFFPATPSSLETGARRGCVVVALGTDIARCLEKVTALRRG